MGKLLLFIVLIYSVYSNKSLFITPQAPKLELSETEGGSLHLGPRMERPLVVAFVVEQCGYSDRALKLMNGIRTSFTAESLDVVGVFLNPTNDQDLAGLKKEKGAMFPLAQGQPNAETIIALHKSFEIKYPGRTIYVVSRVGKIYSVDADKEDASVIFKNLLKTIRKRTNLIASA